MNQRKRSRFLCTALLTCLLLGACGANEKGTEALTGSARPAMSPAEPSPTEIQETPKPTKRPTPTGTPTPIPPSPTPNLLPFPEVETETFSDEATGDVRKIVRSSNPTEGYTCTETYCNDVLQEKIERSVLEGRPAYHRETYYQNGVPAARYETIYTYLDDGLPLSEITIYNDVYYLSGIRYEYTDGRLTHAFYYGKDKVLTAEVERTYDEKGQETYYKATNAQTGDSAVEWKTEYYADGQVKRFEIMAPRKCVYEYWENGSLRIRDGEIAEGVVVHEEYDEAGNKREG